MNIPRCAKEAARILSENGLPDVRIGMVTGDDLLSRFGELTAGGEEFAHIETGEALGVRAEKMVSVNAYLGAAGIVEALNQDARIVITGRCADASLTVGPAVAEFGWAWDDWDRLAAATVAGHLIECGAQATGGMFSDWSDNLPLANVGYPIAELSEAGEVAITKPPGSDGEVSTRTLSEQLIYEIGDPEHYLTPDVDANFSNVRLTPSEQDRVTVEGAKGRSAPERFKVSLAYRDGYAVAAMLVICGRHAERKARASGEMIFDRLQSAGCSPAQFQYEVLGAGDSLPGIWPRTTDDAFGPGEVVLRISARSEAGNIGSHGAGHRASGHLGTAGRHGLYRTPREAFPGARVLADEHRPRPRRPDRPSAIRKGVAGMTDPTFPARIRLKDIAHARSGDKGNHANVGVIAYTEAGFEYLGRVLTEVRVAEFFLPLRPKSVERFALSGIGAYNFLLRDVLAGGASGSLRIDSQGKTLGLAILELELPRPDNLKDMLPSAG